MELTKEQLLQIDKYIAACGIKYYDVRVEIVDHFATILEEKLNQNPIVNFKEEIIKVHKSFSNNGFHDFLKEKTKAVSKQFFKNTFQHLITFFKLPKIIISGALFFMLLELFKLFNNKDSFFLFLLGIGICMSIFIAVRLPNSKIKRENFLSLSLSNGYFQIFHFFVVTLQFFNNRSEESLTNPIHNYLHIGAYVLLFLFFWCGEYVYYKNKKLVKEEYTI